MRLFPIVATVVVLTASSGRADEPCYPNPLRPVHSAALIGPETVAPTFSAGYVASDELRLQRQCLLAESSVSPRAQFAFSLALARPASSPPTPVTVLPHTSEAAPTGPALLASHGFAISQPVLRSAPSQAQGFSLGAISIPAH